MELFSTGKTHHLPHFGEQFEADDDIGAILIEKGFATKEPLKNTSIEKVNQDINTKKAGRPSKK